MCVCVHVCTCTYMCVCVCAYGGHKCTLGAGVTGNCELLTRVGDLNQGPLKEQRMLLTSEPSYLSQYQKFWSLVSDGIALDLC